MIYVHISHHMVQLNGLKHFHHHHQLSSILLVILLLIVFLIAAHVHLVQMMFDYVVFDPINLNFILILLLYILNPHFQYSLTHLYVIVFEDYQLYIDKLEILNDNQALITFSDYDYVDQILLISSNKFMIEDEPLILERMIPKIPKKSRWDQVPSLLTTTPVLSVRDPVVHKLMTHIEYLTKQIREQPNHSQNEIERLEAEVFILKNENAQLKSKQALSSNKNIEQRLIALEDISNRLVNKQNDYTRRERSNSHEKQLKRRRKYKIDEDY